MISPAKAVIQLNGKTFSELSSIELSQSINGHHYFTISIGSEKIGETSNSFLEKARDFVGADLVMEIQNGVEEKLVFRGIVNRIHSSAGSLSELGHKVFIEGHSPTILLDNGNDCQSFNKKGLKDIVDSIVKDYPSNLLGPEVKPMNNQKISYTVQYQETAFNFMNRLASRFGEWFYFDGKSLVFGYKKPPVIELLYGTDLLSFDLGVSVSPIVQSYSAHAYKDNKTESQNISKQKTSMKGNTSFAMDKSSKVFLGAPQSFIQQFDDDSAIKKQIDDITKLALQSEAARKVTFSGVSITPGLAPGVNIIVNNITAGGKAKQGEYIITSVHHSWQTGGQYQNSFTAIPNDSEVPPTTNPSLVPICQAQPAVVCDNKDPEGLGRVKVKFNWQKTGESPWIRIAMPYGGQKKGMYFVPEVNEEVMVGFEGDNAERPFIIGTLYHGNAKPDDWKTDNNDIKAIRTRSGHTIKFDDTKGKEKITIVDKEGNTIEFDSSKKELTITGLEKLNLNAKEININGTDKVNIASKEIKADGTTKVEVTSSSEIKLAATNIESSSTASLKMKGLNVDISGDVMTNIKGGLLNLN